MLGVPGPGPKLWVGPDNRRQKKKCWVGGRDAQSVEPSVLGPSLVSQPRDTPPPRSVLPSYDEHDEHDDATLDPPSPAPEPQSMPADPAQHRLRY